MRKRWLILLTLVGLLLVGMMTPTMLRAVPSRYVARLPEPLQQLGAPRNQSPILPTAASPAGAGQLLQPDRMPVEVAALPDSFSLTTTAAATAVLPPPTPTAPPVAGVTVTPAPTATPLPSPTPTVTPIPIPESHRLHGFTHHFQEWNNCGPATMAMTLSYFGLHVRQAETAAVMKPHPEDRNVSPHEMAAYVNNETPFAALDRANGDLDTVRRLIAAGIPVILEIGIEPPGEYTWMGWYGHYLLVVAYDNAQQQLWVYDSWFGTSTVPGENAHRDGRILTYADVNKYWPQFNRNYITVYRPEQAETVAAIIGENMDDDVMWQNALATARADAAADPENAFFWFNLGTVYNALEQYGEAATAFDQARAIGLPWRMLWYQFGPYEAYYQVGRNEDVVLLADVTLKDRPYFEESFYYRGIALTASGNTAAGRQNLERAAAFNPNFTPAFIALNELKSEE